MQKLQRGLPENVAARQTSAMTMNPRDEFAEALRFLGCVASVEHPIIDG
jgi:hypothetical protein